MEKEHRSSDMSVSCQNADSWAGHQGIPLRLVWHETQEWLCLQSARQVTLLWACHNHTFRDTELEGKNQKVHSGNVKPQHACSLAGRRLSW